VNRLLIGIGNPLRCDDGVGWRLAEAFLGGRRRCPPDLAVRAVHQLTPELAADLARVERVLFVDAWLAPEQARPCLRPLSGSAGRGGPAESHRLEPAALLRLAGTLYGAGPSAHELLIPAHDLGHGERCSPLLRARLPDVQRLLQRWLERPPCTN
jgi:hydrogenase maturation protease